MNHLKQTIKNHKILSVGLLSVCIFFGVQQSGHAGSAVAGLALFMKQMTEWIYKTETRLSTIEERLKRLERRP